MKLSLAFLFISVFTLCFASAQSKPGSTVGQNSAASTQHQQISNGPVAEYVSDSNCTIGWSTSVSGTMTLQYGTDRTKMSQTKEAVGSNDGRNYHVRLDGLTPSTRYYFRVVNAGQAISGVGTFETVSAGDSPISSKAIVPQ
ncbi:MAG: fibronectin type III domain-containing protein [Bryobacteraceae bacterium]|jgi:phosphodiesterase/alkaline phosphatase D-like protein